MTRTKKLSAGIAVVALAAGAGAAVAATKLGSSSPKATLASSNIASFGEGRGSIGGGNLPQGGVGSGGPGSGGLGDGRFDGDGGRGLDRGFGGGPFGDLSSAAMYLGLSTSTLQSDLQSGKTLAGVAKTAGKPVDGLIKAMAAAQKQQIDAFVSAGRLTQAQAQAIEAQITQRVTAMVNGTGPAGRGLGRGFGAGSDDDGGGFGSDDGGGFGGPGSGAGGGNGSSGGGSGTF